MKKLTNSQNVNMIIVIAGLIVIALFYLFTWYVTKDLTAIRGQGLPLN